MPADGSASDQLTVQVNSRPAAFPPGAPVPWSVPSDGLGTLCLFAAMLIAGLARQTEMKRWERRLGASMAIVIGVAILAFHMMRTPERGRGTAPARSYGDSGGTA